MPGATNRLKDRLPTPEEALPGRASPMEVTETHVVTGRSLTPPWPDGSEQAVFGLGCFWGAERRYWQQEGVLVTAAGYAGGITPNPTYEEVCTGGTGHAEVVLVVFEPSRVTYDDLLRLFWESHDPTQGMRQGNDRGTQYRSVIHCHGEAQLQQAKESMARYQEALSRVGRGEITTEILPAPPFYYAETHHQQYLARNPMGYCGLKGTGVSCDP